MPSLNRRDFLKTSAAVACACAVCPRRLLAEGKEVPPIDVGTLKDFDQDGVWDTWTGQGFFVVRLNQRLFAPSAICTHEPVPLQKAKSGTDLYCSEHEALFFASGKVKKGKPKKSLPRCGIKVNDEGHVIVNAGQQYKEAEWEKPEAWVTVK